MIGHLGSRVSALLDGQLPPAEAERAWAHVHVCHACRDLVEREGWIKTRLAGLSLDAQSGAPEHLKGSLLGPRALTSPPVPAYDVSARRHTSLAVLGGGAVGVAVVGMIALGLAGPDAPVDRRPPVTDIGQSGTTGLLPTSGPASGATRVPSGTGSLSTSPSSFSTSSAPSGR